MTDSRAPRRVPAGRALAWLVQSLELLRRQAARLLLLALLLQLVLGLTQLPLVGLLVVLSVPGLTAGILEALHVTAEGGRPELKLLFKPLASGRHVGRLFAMGALVFAVGVLCISLMLSGSEQLTDPVLLERIEQGDIDAMASLDLDSLGRMVMAFMLGVAISGTLSYFAVPLIWFRNRRFGDALGSGLKGLLVNWQPFSLLALGLLVLFLPVALVSGLLFGMVTGGGLGSTMVMGLIMVLLLLFQLMLFGTQYCAFRDIFGIPAPAAPAPGDHAGDQSGDDTGDDSQLVA